MKAVLLADLHLSKYPSWRFEWLMDFLNKDILVHGGVYDLYLLGDVFENKNHLDCEVLNGMIDFLKKYLATSSKVVWICGQHDSYSPGLGSLRSLGGFADSKLTIVDESVAQIDGRFFVPYARQPEEYIRLLSGVPDDSVVFTHVPVNEAIFGGAGLVSHHEFDRFKAVYAGDIHKAGTCGIVRYVGIPCERDWRDKGCEGYYGLLEREGGYDRYIPRLTNAPVHLQVTSKADIPNNRKCIVKCSSGVDLGDALGIIARVDSLADIPVVVDSGKLSGENCKEAVRDYVKEAKIGEFNSKRLIDKGFSFIEA